MKGIWKRFALWTASGLHFVDNFVLRVKSGAPSPAVAAFHAVVLSGEVPLSVEFAVNESIGATSFSWSFGDGGASTETIPSHVYAQAGTYTVGRPPRDRVGRMSSPGRNTSASARPPLEREWIPATSSAGRE